MHREANGPRQDQSAADVWQYGQAMWAKRVSKEEGTYKLIIQVAERFFREIGFQKTTVADIAREIGMSPANVYRFLAAKSEIKGGSLPEPPWQDRD